MCAQCMAGASLAVGGATGIRAWLGTRTWMTRGRLKGATIALLVLALAASATIPGANPAPAPPTAPDAGHAGSGQDFVRSATIIRPARRVTAPTREAGGIFVAER